MKGADLGRWPPALMPRRRRDFAPPLAQEGQFCVSQRGFSERLVFREALVSLDQNDRFALSKRGRSPPRVARVCCTSCAGWFRRTGVVVGPHSGNSTHTAPASTLVGKLGCTRVRLVRCWPVRTSN